MEDLCHPTSQTGQEKPALSTSPPQFGTKSSEPTRGQLAHRPDAHGESVDVLVELVEETDALDDHVVHAVHVELHLGA